MHAALFLDRDGVIIENRPDYVRSWSDVSIYPQALAALARIAESPFKIVIVTNQSVINRGCMTLAHAESINTRLIKAINRAGGRIDGVFMCPHTPEERCPCRKPRPGLILQAAGVLQLDLSRSILIGDALSDIEAGRNAGLLHLALVLTGRGAAQLAAFHRTSNNLPFLVFDSLSAALADLIPTD
jgi:D-glycero-D-manno-heptose 1,7-bisphosphate phosphatase